MYELIEMLSLASFSCGRELIYGMRLVGFPVICSFRLVCVIRNKLACVALVHVHCTKEFEKHSNREG